MTRTWIVILAYAADSLINDNQIPYIDFGHTTVVPAEMAKHMNRDVMLALCPAVGLLGVRLN